MRAAPKLLLLLASLMAAAAGIAPAPAAGAPAPAWSLTVVSYPTNFPPGAAGTFFSGPGYFLVATNSGGASTSGDFTISIDLPAGLAPSATEAPLAEGYAGMTCTVAAPTVSCSGTDPLQPGQLVYMDVPVDVLPGAPPSLAVAGTVSGGGAVRADSASATTEVSPALPSFGFLPGAAGLFAEAIDEDGTAATQAGSHPFQLSVGMSFPDYTGETGELFAIGGGVRSLVANLPPGMVVNPNATPIRCTEAQLTSQPGGFGCPDASQIGIVANALSPTYPSILPAPLYNMVPPPGTAAELAFDAIGAGVFVHLAGGVRSGGDYGLFAEANDILAKRPIFGAKATIWGDPTDESHDPLRGACLLSGGACSLPAKDRLDRPALTMPSACSDPLTTSARADSWEAPGVFDEESTVSEDGGGNPVGVEGCASLAFEPGLAVSPTVTSASTPTGARVSLHVPQSESVAQLATANLKATEVALPAGLTVNPSAANGLEACSPAQIELDGPAPARCPEASKIGTVEVHTPLLDHPVPGAVYVAAPHDNPFGSLLAIYIALHDPETGVVVKLAGEVEARPVGEASSQLVTTFDENPQLPFEDLEVDFFGGPRAPLRTPATCGEHTTTSLLAPWSGTAPVTSSSPFRLDQGAGGGPCPASEAAAPNAPGFEAGTLTPVAGAFSPFLMRLERAAGAQVLRTVEVTLPPGLTGRLAGIPTCPDATLGAAAQRSGRDEQASPLCPPASQVGTVDVGAGLGPQPYYVGGAVYLAGPYRGAPLSLAIVTPAVAGPFDLGTVVVRAALRVDPRTAQVTAVSDSIPTMLEGIPLELRDLRVRTDRPSFTLNPTSCDPMAVQGRAGSLFGAFASLADRFQVGACSRLGFKPRLRLRLFGGPKRGDYQRLRAILRFPRRGAQANVARAAVTLPHSAFLAQEHIRTVCTRVQFAADACPRGSIYGRARAVTPLLDHPLKGPVYLRSSDNTLPDLVAALQGPPQQPIEIELVGRTDSVRGALRNTFDAVPDAPVRKFILELFGGRRGLIVNSRDLCGKGRRQRATVRLNAQNGKKHDFRPVVRHRCPKQRGRPGRGGKRQ